MIHAYHVVLPMYGFSMLIWNILMVFRYVIDADAYG